MEKDGGKDIREESQGAIASISDTADDNLSNSIEETDEDVSDERLEVLEDEGNKILEYDVQHLDTVTGGINDPAVDFTNEQIKMVRDEASRTYYSLGRLSNTTEDSFNKPEEQREPEGNILGNTKDEIIFTKQEASELANEVIENKKDMVIYSRMEVKGVTQDGTEAVNSIIQEMDVVVDKISDRVRQESAAVASYHEDLKSKYVPPPKPSIECLVTTISEATSEAATFSPEQATGLTKESEELAEQARRFASENIALVQEDTKATTESTVPENRRSVSPAQWALTAVKNVFKPEK